LAQEFWIPDAKAGAIGPQGGCPQDQCLLLGSLVFQVLIIFRAAEVGSLRSMSRDLSIQALGEDGNEVGTKSLQEQNLWESLGKSGKE
jgi:hypothetical protein